MPRDLQQTHRSLPQVAQQTRLHRMIEIENGDPVCKTRTHRLLMFDCHSLMCFRELRDCVPDSQLASEVREPLGTSLSLGEIAEQQVAAPPTTNTASKTVVCADVFLHAAKEISMPVQGCPGGHLAEGMNTAPSRTRQREKDRLNV